MLLWEHLTGMARPEFTTKSALVGRAVHIGAWKWPIFQVRNRKKISPLFFSEIFSAHKLFLWLQKIVLDLIYQIRQEYRDLRCSVPPIFEFEGGTPKMTKNHPKRLKMAFLARLMGSGNKNSCKQCWETKEIHFWPFFTDFGQFFIFAWFHLDFWKKNSERPEMCLFDLWNPLGWLPYVVLALKNWLEP